VNRCGDVKEPEGWVCDMPAGRHAYHSVNVGRDLRTWPNEQVLSQQAARSSRPGGRRERYTQANVIAAAVRPVTHAVPKASPSPVFDRPGWVLATSRAFHDFCLNRAEPFTTAEHFWPTIEAPAEMRALSQVIQAALRKGWIGEVGSRRLNDTYRSKDGIEFKMNKIVPVYQSKVCRKGRP
jgi:hypothetical protein